MIYGSNKPYGTNDTYGNAGGGSSPNAVINLSSLGAGGIISILLGFPFPNVQGVDVDLNDLTDGKILIDLSSSSFEVADAGELWKRVPRHSQSNYLP